MAQLNARIIGIGSYLPSHILDNHALEQMVETSDEWIITRTGIKERRLAAENEFTSTMGASAAKQAIENAKINSSQIDAIIVATMTPDYISPATACLIQKEIGAQRAAAIDIQAACTGFLYGLSIAKAWVESGMYQTVLLVASEKNSAFVDYTDRNTCVLFGDGAGAVVISNQGAGYLIGPICLGADGEQAALIEIPAGGSRHPASSETLDKKLHSFKMNGREVFKHAVRRMEQAVNDCIDKAGLTEHDVSWLVPHQANVRIMEAISKRFNIPEDRVFKTIQKYGNTSASSVAIALDELHKSDKIKANEHLVLFAFGAGLTWGSALLTKNLS